MPMPALVSSMPMPSYVKNTMSKQWNLEDGFHGLLLLRLELLHIVDQASELLPQGLHADHRTRPYESKAISHI
jgi:hypothetical protein